MEVDTCDTEIHMAADTQALETKNQAGPLSQPALDNVLIHT